MMNLQPGPEFDRLVAEKVMGWKLGDSWGGAYYVDTDGCSRYERTLFKPSQEWECMRLVVEEMQRRGFKFMLIETNNGKWKAVFYNGYTRSHIYAEAFENTAPHAVCMAARAAISALEGQEDE